MIATPIADVSDTALWVANFRAWETARTDALFQDPLASRLVQGRGEEIARQMKDSNVVAWSVAIRTVVIDEFIRNAVAQGFDTVLNLGAGLDTRPYRMDLSSSLHWVEADFPHMISFKEERLREEIPRCELRRISVDLSDAEARQRLFSEVGQTAKKALVLTEGVIPYLTEEQVRALATDLHAQPTFIGWVLDRFSKHFMKYRNRAAFAKQLVNAPFQFDPDNWDDFFLRQGWKAKQIKFLGLEGFRLGRSPPMPRQWWLQLAYVLMPKSKKMEMAQMTGYALMERA